MADLEEVMRRWLAGWRASRGLPVAQEIPDGLWIHCAQPSREFEIFALHADEDPESLSRTAARVLAAKELTWLTAATTNPEQTASAIEAAGLEVLYRSESLMTIDLDSHPRRALDPAYTCDVRSDGAAIKVVLRDRVGETAARGQIGVAGADAVADRIETMPGHRRRGLGGVVMGVLAAEAAARGSRNGLLIASDEGRHLYASLGWNRLAVVIIAQAPAAGERARQNG